MVGAQNTHIPIKPAMASVMPIIFASSFMTFPALIIELINPQIANTQGFWRVVYDLSIATSSSNVGWNYVIINAVIYLLLIIGFTYFYTYATFNPLEVAANIKRNGGFIPGIRAGKPTSDYLSSVLSKVVLFGCIFLAVIAIIPMFAKATGLNTAFGGSSILILVGVAIELEQQLESLLVMRHYKGFLNK
jgi:preprotein translocase subunit SecY